MDEFLQAAFEEAKLGLSQQGVPIGSVLVVDGKIVGRGHNQREQRGSVVLHAEMDCLERAGRIDPDDYKRAVLYSTLSPCDMCSGAVLLYGIPTIVVGDNLNFRGPEDYLRQRGVDMKVVNDARIVEFFRRWTQDHPELWYEDIGKKFKAPT